MDNYTLAGAERHKAYLEAVAHRYLPDMRDCEECVCDVMLKVHTNGAPPLFLKAYLTKCVRNEALNILKASRTAKRGGLLRDTLLGELEDCIPDTKSDTPFERVALSQLLSAFIQAQTPENRALFIQRYFTGLSVCELCGKHQMSQSKVKSRLFSMRKQLKQMLEREDYTI